MISLADLKTYLGITVTTYDTLLGQLILSATAMIENIIGKGIVSASYTEYADFTSSKFDLQEGEGFDLNQVPLQIFLKNFPVISVTSVKYGTPQQTLIAGTDYTIENQTGIITLSGQAGDVYESLIVEYVAGYASAPMDLQQVCKELVKEMFGGAKGATQGSGIVKSKSVGDLSVSYELGNIATSKHSSILNRYISPEV